MVPGCSLCHRGIQQAPRVCAIIVRERGNQDRICKEQNGRSSKFVSFCSFIVDVNKLASLSFMDGPVLTDSYTLYSEVMLNYIYFCRGST